MRQMKLVKGPVLYGLCGPSRLRSLYIHLASYEAIVMIGMFILVFLKFSVRMLLLEFHGCRTEHGPGLFRDHDVEMNLSLQRSCVRLIFKCQS